MKTHMDITADVLAGPAAALGCEAPIVRVSVEDLLQKEIFGREALGIIPNEGFGILPSVPAQPLFNQEIQQEQYAYASQEWCDYWWCRKHFQFFRYIGRTNGDMILVEMRRDMLVEGQSPVAHELLLTASKSMQEMLGVAQ